MWRVENSISRLATSKHQLKQVGGSDVAITLTQVPSHSAQRMTHRILRFRFNEVCVVKNYTNGPDNFG